MYKKRLLLISAVIAFLTIFIPLKGIEFPMELNASIVKGFPFSFLGFFDAQNSKTILSYFQSGNFFSIGVNLLNYLATVSVVYLISLLIIMMVDKRRRGA